MFAKGMFAIFTIKLLFFSLIFLNQACTNESDENSEVNLAKNSFLESLNISRENLSNVKVIEQRNSYARTENNDLTELKLTKTDPNSEIIINNFNEALDLITSGDLENEENECINDSGNLCLTVYVDEDEVNNSLIPSIQAAKSYLKTQYDLTDYEISEILDGNEEVILINMAQVIIEGKSGSSHPIGYNKSINLFSQPMYAANYQENIGSKAWGCFKSVIGVDLAISAIDALYSEYTDDIAMSMAERQARKSGAKAALKRLAIKTASKFVGGIGAVVAAVEFGICMAK
jgi:hypothetical protein